MKSSSAHHSLFVNVGPHSTKSRRLLAVPFVGKDVPSRASEFSHPDVVIGFSILAYRYEGLRRDDFRTLLRALRERLLALGVGVLPLRRRQHDLRDRRARAARRRLGHLGAHAIAQPHQLARLDRAQPQARDVRLGEPEQVLAAAHAHLLEPRELRGVDEVDRRERAAERRRRGRVVERVVRVVEALVLLGAGAAERVQPRRRPHRERRLGRRAPGHSFSCVVCPSCAAPPGLARARDLVRGTQTSSWKGGCSALF